MGKRACVVINCGDDLSSATYLQLNGGPEWVAAFLDRLERHNARVDAGDKAHPRDGRIPCAAPFSLRTIHDDIGGER